MKLSNNGGVLLLVVVPLEEEGVGSGLPGPILPVEGERGRRRSESLKVLVVNLNGNIVTSASPHWW